MARTPAALPAGLDVPQFHTRFAESLGVPRGRLRAADLDAPFVGVRSVTGPPESVLALADAYRPLLAPGEFFSHSTAALLHGMWLPLQVEQELRLHVSVHKPQRAPRDRRVQGHHLVTRPMMVIAVQGMPTANPVEAWCQLAGQLSARDLAVAADSLLAKGRPRVGLRLERLQNAASDEHRPWNRRLRRAVGMTRIGSRSPWESILRMVLIDAGLPEPEMNRRLYDPSGVFVAECDLVYRAARVLIEYEGDGHRDPKQYRKDIRRYERLADLGWRVIRVTVDDIRLRPLELIARIRTALESRAA